MHGLADAVLLLHALIVAFILGGALYIWIGAWRDWPGIRSPMFRYVHLGAMLFVAAEAVLGKVCPLTVWENAFRGKQTQTGFIAHWVRQIIYYDLPAWVFTLVYVLFAGVLIVTLMLVPPRKIGVRSRMARPPTRSISD